MEFNQKTGEAIADLLAKDDVSISEACSQCGITVITFHTWRKEVAEFANMLRIAEEIKFENRMILAQIGQKKLLTGYLHTEEVVLYDANDEITGRKFTRKWIPPRANAIIHALNALNDRYAHPDRYNNPSAPDEKPSASTNPVINFSPNIYLNIPQSAKSLKIGESTKN